MYKLWFLFAKRRILGTRRNYFYVYDLCAFSGLRNAVLVIIWFCSYSIVSSVFLKRPLTSTEMLLFVSVFLLVSEALTHFTGLALQRTVYVLDLPWYLKERSIFISGHNKREKATEQKKHQDNVKDLKKTKENLAFRFIKHALKFAVLKLFSKAVKRNNGLSDIRKGGKRKHIGRQQVKVSKGESEQNSFFSACKLGGKEKSEEKGQSIDGRAGSGSGQHLDAPGGRDIRSFKYCALSAVGNNTKGDFGFPNPDGEKRPVLAYDDLPDRDSCKDESRSVADFVEKDGDVACNCKGSYEYQHFHRFLSQLPVNKLSTVMKFLILVSSPLWLIHLLFDRGKIRMVSFAEYNGVDDVYSGWAIDGGGAPWEADRDAIINAIVSGLWGSIVCGVVLR